MAKPATAIDAMMDDIEKLKAEITRLKARVEFLEKKLEKERAESAEPGFLS